MTIRKKQSNQFHKNSVEYMTQAADENSRGSGEKDGERDSSMFAERR